MSAARVPFDPKVAGYEVAHFQIDLSPVIQDAQVPTVGIDNEELRLLWMGSLKNSSLFGGAKLG